MEIVKEKWSSTVNTVTIGATKEDGGTRSHRTVVGGMSALPFLSFEGSIPHRPAFALEVLDRVPEDYPEALRRVYGDVIESPGRWAEMCVQKFGADLISLRLLSTHPDEGDTGPEEAVKAVRSVIDSTGAPVIVIGSGMAEKDNAVMPAVSRAARGEACLLGAAVQENYRTLVASALEDGHSVIAESPIDINIAKQLNIMMHEMGLPLDRIVMYPTTGALGYGLEYAYSIMERSRIAALSGDGILGVPMICYAGAESWKVKESRTENASWGDRFLRGVAWEVSTAGAFLHAGSDILILYHPEALSVVKGMTSSLSQA
jgi:acetyl-CoA decarbonylase/synthase complex subunit delta